MASEFGGFGGPTLDVSRIQISDSRFQVFQLKLQGIKGPTKRGRKSLLRSATINVYKYIYIYIYIYMYM